MVSKRREKKSVREKGILHVRLTEWLLESRSREHLKKTPASVIDGVVPAGKYDGCQIVAT